MDENGVWECPVMVEASITDVEEQGTAWVVSATCTCVPGTGWLECTEWTNALVSDACPSLPPMSIGCGCESASTQVIPSLGMNVRCGVWTVELPGAPAWLADAKVGFCTEEQPLELGPWARYP